MCEGVCVFHPNRATTETENAERKPQCYITEYARITEIFLKYTTRLLVHQFLIIKQNYPDRNGIYLLLKQQLASICEYHRFYLVIFQFPPKN